MGGEVSDLGAIRAEIDVVDDEIAALLARRFALAKSAAFTRSWSGRPRDTARETAIVTRLRDRCGYAPGTVETVFRELFDGAPREASIGE